MVARTVSIHLFCTLLAGIVFLYCSILTPGRNADGARLQGVVGGQRLDGTGGFSDKFPDKCPGPRRAVGRPGGPARFAILQGAEVGFVAVF